MTASDEDAQRPRLRAATTYPAVVGAVLVNLREERGISQQTIAAEVGVKPSTWSRAERGISAITIDHLARASLALEVSPGEVLGLADDVCALAKRQGLVVVPQRMSGLLASSRGYALVGREHLNLLLVTSDRWTVARAAG